MANEKVTLAHGAGGKLSRELMDEVILPAYGNPVLNELHDGAAVNMSGRVAFTTDSYVVQPLFSRAATSASWPSAARSTTCR